MDIAERAAFHAALGDRLRLEIVDRLVLNDLSPGDLAGLLDLPSNLLAHHLRVLEQAGIITRTRSEGDARRTYVRLRTDNALLVALHPTPRLGDLAARRRVVFVCTKNSARSQLAASAWREVSDVPVASAGTHPAADGVHPDALRVADQHGLSVAGTQTWHVDEVVTPDDLVVAVCDQVHEELPRQPRLHWSVPDPVRRGSLSAFESALDEISQRVEQLAGALSTPPSPN